MRKGNLIFKNIFYSTATRLVILALGLVLPRLLIVSFGSEVNGLLSTITQIFTYLALVEAGIGNSAVNALYKPLEERNYEEANGIVCEARSYYRRVSLVYGACIILFAATYPFLAKTTLSKWLIFGVVALQGGANFISYYFTAVHSQLLIADGKRYITENISFLSYICTSLIKILLIVCGFNVIAVQFGHFIINIIKIPVFSYICKKKYKWLDWNKKPSLGKLRERKAFVVHEISNTIFNNTDVFIVAVFCSFEMASVYTVYNMVYSSITAILANVNSGLGFVLGRTQHKGIERLTKVYDVYSAVYICTTFVLFTVSHKLILPFVELYTAGVSDTNYMLEWLPLLFTIISLLSGARATAALLITVSGHAETTKNRSIIEAFINLASSLILVNVFGIYGVLLGTIVALLYRANDIIIYANKTILKRNPLKEYKTIAINLVVYAAIVFLMKFDFQINNYFSFMVNCIIVTVLVAILFLISTMLANPTMVVSLIKFLKNRKSKGSN